MILKKLAELMRRMDEHSKNFNKQIENKISNRSHRAKETQ